MFLRSFVRKVSEKLSPSTLSSAPDRQPINMAALSKHYAEIVKQLTCTELFHPGRHCGQYAAENFGKIFQLCAKFYTPMVLVSFLFIPGCFSSVSRNMKICGLSRLLDLCGGKT